MRGCRGNVGITANVGEIPTLDFTFTGVYIAPDDSAILTPTYTNQDDPVIFKNDNVTVSSCCLIQVLCRASRLILVTPRSIANWLEALKRY